LSSFELLMVSQKVVTPVKTGVQSFDNYPKSLDSGACPGLRSGIRRNDGMRRFLTFCEFINFTDKKRQRA